MSDPERELESFIAKFSSDHQVLIRALRKAMRRRFATAFELVWDNYNFLVIAYCATVRPSSAVVTLAAGANGVGLSFYRGAELDDPHGILLGEGSQNRFVRLPDVDTLMRADVAALIDQAALRAPFPMPGTGSGELVIRSISAKQRPRRRS